MTLWFPLICVFKGCLSHQYGVIYHLTWHLEISGEAMTKNAINDHWLIVQTDTTYFAKKWPFFSKGRRIWWCVFSKYLLWWLGHQSLWHWRKAVSMQPTSFSFFNPVATNTQNNTGFYSFFKNNKSKQSATWWPPSSGKKNLTFQDKTLSPSPAAIHVHGLGAVIWNTVFTNALERAVLISTIYMNSHNNSIKGFSLGQGFITTWVTANV